MAILSQNLNDALNQQVLHEYRNQLIYTQIACYFEDLQLKHLASYFRDAAQHEKEHGDHFVAHINDRTGGKVVLGDVNAPVLSLTDPASVGDAYIQVEESTTASIEEIYELAFNERSFMDLPFLQSMLEEQIEEENKSQEFAQKIKLVKDIVLFDATLGG